MKLIMEGWRDYLKGDHLSLIVQSVIADRDLGQALDFVSKTTHNFPRIKAIMQDSNIEYRWSSTVDKLHLQDEFLAGWAATDNSGRRIINHNIPEWEGIVAKNHRDLRKILPPNHSEDQEKEYIKLLKTVTVTLLAPTTVHELAHHADPDDPTNLYKYFDLLDPKNAEKIEYLDDPDHPDFEWVEEKEVYAISTENEYTDYIFGPDGPAIKYVLKNVNLDIFDIKAEDIKKIILDIQRSEKIPL